MSHPMYPSRDEPTRNLLGDWNLVGDAQSGVDEPDDSLFAPPKPPAVAPAENPRAPGPQTRVGSNRDLSAIPFQDFQIDPGPNVLGDFAEFLVPGSRPAPLSLRSGGGSRLAETKPGPGLSGASKPPKPGDVLSGFRLVAELGRGAFARVFLAEQVVLGDRRVALKVSKAEGDEPQMLARLQHAHIVPILSLHDDPLTGLRMLCMPYLGGANLAQVLEAAGGSGEADGDPLSLVDALDEVSLRLQTSGSPVLGLRRDGFAESEPPPLVAGAGEPAFLEARGGIDPHPGSVTSGVALGSLSKLQALWGRLIWKAPSASYANLEDRDFDQPARQFLRQADSIQAAVWIVARLAEGLEHAHSRGLLHRDLKPSNILIAGDGTPMLLDFNLSTSSRPDTDTETEGEKAMLGGTLPYMSPEHLDAFHPDGHTSPLEVNERSDVYSLGLILFEMIAGEHPFPEPPSGMPMLQVIRFLAEQRKAPPSLREANPAVPWGLDSIVAKCLDFSPARRFARARDFAEDLNRFLEDLPLKYAPEPSPRERLAKWARRNPRLCSATTVATLAGLLLVSVGGLVGLLAHNMQNLSARLKLQVFRSELNESRFLLNLAGGPVSHLGRGVTLGERTIDQQGLSNTGEPRGDSWLHRLTRAEQSEVREETTELILLTARAKVALADQKAGTDAERTAALKWAVVWLGRAERLDPNPPAVLHADRARYLSALGRADLAAQDRKAEADRLPTTARDYTLLGSARLARGEFVAAESALLRAIDLDPRSFWAWFSLGHCRLEQGRDLDAVADFSACVAIEPRFAWPHLNRGVALARAGRLEEARSAYRRALKANSRFAEAWLDLGLADLELNDLFEAEHALTRAVALGRDEVGVLAALAEVKARRGDRDGASRSFDKLLRDRPDDPALLTARGIFRVGFDPDAARADLDRVLELDPRHARAHLGLGLLARKADPREALRHAEAALDADPQLLDALQLRALLRARSGDLAAIDDAERLCRNPTPHRLYNAACALALLVENAREPRYASRAVAILERALDAGFPPAQADADPDLRALHSRDDFRATIARRRGQTTAKVL